MEQDEIRNIIKETISELKRQGLIRANTAAEVSEMLMDYFHEGAVDERITEALKKIESDPYYKIIPLYYDYGETWERIAELFSVERNTIYRNRRRLLMLIYEALQKGE